jgi:hypothetical protein
MSDFRRQRCTSWIALAAIWGAFLATPGFVDASTIDGRHCAPAALAACCAARPETCTKACCTSSVSDLRRNGAEELATTANQTASRTTCIPAACECRTSEPAAPPDTKPVRRMADERFENGLGLAFGWLGRSFSPARVAIVLQDTEGLLKCPLHILTTHLRF